MSHKNKEVGNNCFNNKLINPFPINEKNLVMKHLKFKLLLFLINF